MRPFELKFIIQILVLPRLVFPLWNSIPYRPLVIISTQQRDCKLNHFLLGSSDQKATWSFFLLLRQEVQSSILVILRQITDFFLTQLLYVTTVLIFLPTSRSSYTFILLQNCGFAQNFLFPSFIIVHTDRQKFLYKQTYLLEEGNNKCIDCLLLIQIQKKIAGHSSSRL